ncbi:hypothetical protein B0H19DRAFT_1072029 [Mycena capillaripes]|nr:hypothetical protein B0H19DRAFT_1072029 [Mycena capillaripes]
MQFTHLISLAVFVASTLTAAAPAALGDIEITFTVHHSGIKTMTCDEEECRRNGGYCHQVKLLPGPQRCMRKAMSPHLESGNIEITFTAYQGGIKTMTCDETECRRRGGYCHQGPNGICVAV